MGGFFYGAITKRSSAERCSPRTKESTTDDKAVLITNQDAFNVVRNNTVKRIHRLSRVGNDSST